MCMTQFGVTQKHGYGSSDLSLQTRSFAQSIVLNETWNPIRRFSEYKTLSFLQQRIYRLICLMVRCPID